MIHRPHVASTQVKIDYQAYCQCGWKGEVRKALSTAQNDANRHSLRENGSGPIA